MTRRMQQFIDTLRSLPESEQDDVVQFLQNELAEDQRWSITANLHADKLRKLTDQITADDDKALCEPLDPGTLVCAYRPVVPRRWSSQ